MPIPRIQKLKNILRFINDISLKDEDNITDALRKMELSQGAIIGEQLTSNLIKFEADTFFDANELAKALASIEDSSISVSTYTENWPSDFQEVEYIEATGTQYINTGILPDDNTGIYIDCEMESFNSSNYIHLLSSRYPVISIMAQSGNYVQFEYGPTSSNYNSYRTYLANGIDVFDRHVYSIINKIAKVDSQELGTSTKTLTQSQYPLYLFAGNSSGSLNINQADVKLYLARIYNGSIIDYEFVPCYHKTTGFIGLYDTVHSKFYMNSGTGTFIKGPDVTGG